MHTLTSAPAAPSIDDRFVLQTPRPRMLEIIHRTLRQREPITLGPTQFRFCKRGDEFDEGALRYQTRETGLYQRFGVWLSTTPLNGPPHHYTWCYVGDLGWFEEVLNPILDGLSAYERECALVQMTFRTVMRQMRENRSSTHPTTP